MAIRRIGMFGGPGVGKSALAAWLFGELKARGYPVEHVQETVKEWAFINRKPEGMDQVFLFASQLHKEDVILRRTSAVVVSESPIHLGLCYGRKMGMPGIESLKRLADVFESMYPSANFFVEREGFYLPEGRFESKEEAEEIDRLILDTAGVPMTRVRRGDKLGLLEMALQAIGG